MRKTTWLIILTSLLAGDSVHACATSVDRSKTTNQNWQKYFKEHTRASSKREVASEVQLPNANLSPWGGDQPNQWRPEAEIANCVSDELNRAWLNDKVNDVLVAVPIKMLNSSIRPYGDGQTNSAITYGREWRQNRPPLVATLIKFKDKNSRLKLRVHPAVENASDALILRYFVDSKVADHQISNPKKAATGDFEFVWDLEPNAGPEWGDLFQNHVAFIQLKGSKNWFVLDFRDTAINEKVLINQIPPPKRNLGRGTLLDPEDVGVRSKNAPKYPFMAMSGDQFGRDIKGDRYFPVPGKGIHNEFSFDQKTSTYTAVGHGNTLVMEKSPAPFKLAYICFDARNRKDEAKFKVPSGSGWHEIGDSAETVINSLENSAILFGYANGQPVASTPSGDFAYGLSDLALFRKLLPGTALVTSAGMTTTKEQRENSRGKTLTNQGRNYHWFAFHQSHEVCAVEWVHPCVPNISNNLGFNCGQ